ncbi:MAG: protein-L-isoaspartate(D-aspartate) O-methyltransferase, partial [Acidobacteria bacterium]|nr:protein-L-isoaspartate(D-aspartate) O-methyltransferase [Acidobacteriota bacterium]
EVPREMFIPRSRRAAAYDDAPLPLAGGQTISQPYVVARMTEELGLRGDERVLEVGTGSGYQTAILARVAAAVYSMERDALLLERAREVLTRLGYDTVHLRHGDGRLGWPEMKPFGGILVAAVGREPPPALLAQLAPGARLVMPLKDPDAEDGEVLVRLERQGEGFRRTPLFPVRFVPLLAGIR